MPPTVPINHCLRSQSHRDRTANLNKLSHASICKAYACWEHSNFLKVKDASSAPRNQAQLRISHRCRKQLKFWLEEQTKDFRQISNYELFNRSNFNIRFWSWNYRGCWHQTCPPIANRLDIYIKLIPRARPEFWCALLFLVTTSLCQDWVICAPAAFLRRGSRYSGSLSEIEP